MNIIAWIGLYGIIGFFEISSLFKNNMKKESILYIIAFSAAFIVSIVLASGVKIPSHDLFIGRVIRSFIGE